MSMFSHYGDRRGITFGGGPGGGRPGEIFFLGGLKPVGGALGGGGAGAFFPKAGVEFLGKKKRGGVDGRAGPRRRGILCFNVTSCRVECPASVDIPKNRREIKATVYVRYQRSGVGSDWLMGRIDVWSAAIAVAGGLVVEFSVATFGRCVGWGENLFGLSAAREIPPLVVESFVAFLLRRVGGGTNRRARRMESRLLCRSFRQLSTTRKSSCAR